MDTKLVVAGASIGLHAISQSTSSFLVMFPIVATVTFMILPSVAAAWVVAATSLFVSWAMEDGFLKSTGGALIAFPVVPAIAASTQFGSVTYLFAALVKHFGGSWRTSVLVATSFMVGMVLLGLRYIKKKSESNQ